MINNSYLLGLYGITSSTTSTTAATTSSSTTKQPTPPWSSSAVVPKADALVRAALAGRSIVNEGSVTVDQKSASADYRKLFALYQGLETLNALTNRAAVKGVSALELSQLNKRFASGLSEVGTWLQATGFADIRMVQGTAVSTSKSSAGVVRDSAVSVTAPIHEGSPDDVVAAFQGETVFDITLKRSSGAASTVSIDLDEMGSTPRSLTNVLSFINGKLEAAGFETRIGREMVKAEPKTIQVSGKTVTLPAGPDQWRMVIRGVSTETVSFSAPKTSDSVSVVQATSSGTQLLKFLSDGGTAETPTGARVGETQWVDGRLSQTNLPEGVEAVRASATAPDGSLWIVADLSAGASNQPIKGERDVALMKIDSAGRVVSTRTLGAADTASGYAIAIDADGKVAVAGSVIGALEAGKSGDVAGEVDSFVSVFDADGAHLWTQRRGARAADEATSVSFGPDGTVYVAGRAQSAMPGAAGAGGGWDAYVQGFSASQPYPTAAWTSKALDVEQFGTAGDDSVQATAIDGSDLYTAGVENGRLIVRRFTIAADGSTSLAATRDLGLASGEVAGLSVSGGRVILAGQTRNAALDVGQITSAHSGETDAYVIALESDLSASADDRLTYLGGVGEDTVADVKVHDGKVWLTGVADRPADAKDEDPTRAYLSRIDPLTGAVEWTRQWDGDGAQATPSTLAVTSNGASVLDRLGLPQGEIVQSSSKKLVDATSLRVGDRFYVSPANGGRAVAVTIDARDTLQTLARKIEQASNMTLKVDVSSIAADKLEGDLSQNALVAGMQRLTITARTGKAGAVLRSGEAGRDALAGLGLSAGFIGPTSGDKAVETFGLDLSQSLNLSSSAAIKAAGESLQAAMTAVRNAYRALAPQTSSSATSGTVPAYLTNQLANYQAALARLTGG